MGVYFKGYEVSPWDITKSYPIGSVVKYDGREYLAKKDVPVGINIGMNDYWDFGDGERLDNLEEAVDELDATVQNLELDSLTDVDVTEPTDGQVLVYNEETKQFENKDVETDVLVLSSTPEIVGKYLDGSNLYRISLSGTAINIAQNDRHSILDVSSLNVKRIVMANGGAFIQATDSPSTNRTCSLGQFFFISALQSDNTYTQITDFCITQNYTNPANITYDVTIWFIVDES